MEAIGQYGIANLTIKGKKAFHIGNICNTCSFFFERLEGAATSINAEEVIKQLNGGLTNLEPTVVQALERIMPKGKYIVLLQTVRPMLTQPGEKHDYFSNEQVMLWGMPGFWGFLHFPKTEYYRLRSEPLTQGRGLFEFLIPIFPQSWLEANRVAEYQNNLNRGDAPTAITLSMLDIKSPADWDEGQEITSHWCLAHYLLDGHHKTYAASLSNTPLTLLSFLSMEQGVSSEEEIAELVAILKKN